MRNDKIRSEIKKIMNDLMHNNVKCDYMLHQNGVNIYLQNIAPLDAYMKAYDMSRNGDIECYISSPAGPAFAPIFTVMDGVPRLSNTYALSPIEDRLLNTNLVAECGIENYMFTDEDYKAIADRFYKHAEYPTLDDAIKDYLCETKEALERLTLDVEPEEIFPKQ